MTEPPGIEGYLTRIKVATSKHQPVYLATHDGLLFTLLPSNANPPKPPGLAPQPPGPDTENLYSTLREEEVRRGSSQVFHARSVMDLRDIVAVRRAFSPVPIASEAVEESRRPLWSEDDDGPVEVERLPEDEEDVGGDEGLSKVDPGAARDRVRMRRGFELLLQTGKVIRYEVSTLYQHMHLMLQQSSYISLGTFCEGRHRMDRTPTSADSLLETAAPYRCSTRDGRSTLCDRSTENHSSPQVA